MIVLYLVSFSKLKNKYIMKRIKIYSVFILLSLGFLINGCSKKNDKNDAADCSALSTAYSNALSAYLSNPSKANCTDVYQKLKNYLDGCAVLTPAERESLNNSLAQENCSD
jgi:hypothetical protein